MKYSDIHLTPIRGNRYRVNKEIIYKDVTIPVGFRTNGADIPRIFWSIFPPNKSDYLPAVIVHDFLCHYAITYKDYVKADWYFEDILRDLGVGKVARWLLVTSVKSYHKHKYGRDLP